VRDGAREIVRAPCAAPPPPLPPPPPTAPQVRPLAVLREAFAMVGPPRHTCMHVDMDTDTDTDTDTDADMGMHT